VRSIYNFSYFNPYGEPGVFGSGTYLGAPRYVPENEDYKAYYISNASYGSFAENLSVFVNEVLRSTGASQVNIVAHSEGGDLVRSYIKFYGGGLKIHKLLTIGSPHHGFQDAIREKVWSEFFSNDPAWMKYGINLELDVSPMSGRSADIIFEDRAIPGVRNRWCDLVGYNTGVPTVTIAGTLTNIPRIIVPYDNDGFVAGSSAHLGNSNDLFAPNAYVTHSYNGANEEYSEATCTYLTEYIKNWMIDEVIRVDAHDVGNFTFVPNPWEWGEGRVHSGVDYYNRTLALQVQFSDVYGGNFMVLGFPLYQYTKSVADPVWSLNPAEFPHDPATPFLVKCHTYDMAGEVEKSDFTFGITPNNIPARVALEPFENLYRPGQPLDVRWRGLWHASLRTEVFFSSNDGESWSMIHSRGPETNRRGELLSFLWTIPDNICSPNCKMKIGVWLDYKTPLWHVGNTFSILAPNPTPPTNVTAQSNDEDLVHLFWVNTYNWAKGFGIWRRVAGGGYPHDPNFYAQYTNRCDDNTAERGTTYYYQIKTQDYCGNWSAASDEVSATTLWLSTPNLDPYRTVAISHNQVHIEFGDPSRHENGYIIERRIYGSGQQFTEVGRSISSLPPNEKINRVEFDDFNNLQSSTKYVYRVLGYEGDPPFRYSAYSDTDTVTTRGYLSSTKALATAYNNGRKIVRDDAGRLHLVYTDGSYANYIYSSDNGYTWSTPEYWMNPVWNDSVFMPAIAVEHGSNPKVYVAYVGWWKVPSEVELKVMVRNPGEPNGERWQELFHDSRYLPALSHKRWGPPSLMIDSQNRPHVVWQYWNDDSNPIYQNQVGLWHWWQDAQGRAHLAKLFPGRPSDETNPAVSMDADTVCFAFEGTTGGHQRVWTSALRPPDYSTEGWVQDGWLGVHPSLWELGNHVGRCVWEEPVTRAIYSAEADNLGWIWGYPPIYVSAVQSPSATYPFLVGNYCVWGDNVSNNWEVYYSQKVGDTWSPKVNVSQSPSASSKYPHAVFYQQGRPIYNKYLGVVWTEGNGPPDPYQVKYQSVRLPWDVAYSTSREATGYNNAKRFLADGQGNLYLTYASKDSVFYVSTTDGGDNWSAPLALGPGQSPALNLDLNGNPCATWRLMEGDSLRLYFARRGPSGWSVSEIYSEKPPFIASLSPPSVAIDRADTAHVLFEYSTVGPVGAWKVYYGNFAVSSPRLMPLDVLDSMGMAPDSVPVSPSICVDGRGTVHAVWSDLTGEVRYRKRAQGPWSSKVNLSNSSTASYHPTISSWGPVAVAWQEEVTPGAPEIFYRTIGDSLFSSIQNLSNTPSASSAEPIISGSKVLWVENVNGDNEIYQAKFDSETMAWSAPGSVSTTEALSTHPQAAISQTEQSTWAYSVWTEEVVPDRAYQILFAGQELPAQPAYALDLGQSEPSPMVVQRDGFIQYGPEPARTVDYDTTELVYHLTNLNPYKRTKLVLSFYHESHDDWKMKLEADHVSLGMVHVPSGQEVVFEKWLPPCVYDDGEVTLRIIRERGDFAVLGKLLVYEYAHGGGGGGPQSAEGALPAPPPTVFALAQSYPNPMRDNATIRYQLPVETQVSLKVYNVIGQVVRELASGKQKAGYYKAVWDSRDGSGRSVSSGVYFYRLNAGGFTKTNKLIVVR
jgi:hypothetical protein